MIAARTKYTQIYGHYSESSKAIDYYSLKLLFKFVANVGFYCRPHSFERLELGFFIDCSLLMQSFAISASSQFPYIDVFKPLGVDS